MYLIRLLLGASLLISTPAANAFESDVHYGLTEWLALKAGFDQQAAQTIATGNQRVDSGDMQYIDPVFTYACLRKDDVGSRRAGEHHYPSTGAIPAAPELRAVAPGSDAANKPALAVLKVPVGQASFMLLKLGEALHVLQDSWSHQGIPDIPQPADALFTCDPTRAWGHPKARGGWNSHKADLTLFWPTDTVAMAKATYDVLTQYPMLSGVKRTPREWDEIRPALDRFITASTKTEKKSWFVSQGISDVSFLEGSQLEGRYPTVRPEMARTQAAAACINAVSAARGRSGSARFLQSLLYAVGVDPRFRHDRVRVRCRSRTRKPSNDPAKTPRR